MAAQHVGHRLGSKTCNFATTMPVKYTNDKVFIMAVNNQSILTLLGLHHGKACRESASGTGAMASLHPQRLGWRLRASRWPLFGCCSRRAQLARAVPLHVTLHQPTIGALPRAVGSFSCISQAMRLQQQSKSMRSCRGKVHALLFF
eukprot:6481666-Amphidinium_carterae.1